MRCYRVGYPQFHSDHYRHALRGIGENKTIYRKDDISVLGVYEGITEQDIIDYAKRHSPLKIAVTYDSLPRTIRALETAGHNPYKDIFLLVDE